MSVLTQNVIKQLIDYKKPLGISRIADITQLDPLGLPVVTCIRPYAKHLSISQGKGLTKVDAQVSAMMEALEAYQLENPPEIALEGQYTSLNSQYPVISPTFFSRGSFLIDDESTPFSWIRAQRYYRNQVLPCFIPQYVVNINSTVRRQAFSYAQISSNGIGAGVTEDHAMCHALFEAVERHCNQRWQHETPAYRAERCLDLASIDDEVVQRWIQHCQQCDLSVTVWDMSFYRGLPTYYCLLEHRTFHGIGRLAGSGTHFSRRTALLRALLEAIQAKVAITSGNRDDIFPWYYRQMKSRAVLYYRVEKVFVNKVIGPIMQQQRHLDLRIIRLIFMCLLNC